MIWTCKYWLWSLWLLPILAWLFRRAATGAERNRKLFAEPPMSERLAPARSGARGALRAALILAGVALLLIAAAGPRGGGESIRVERKGADIQILLDISRSMLSDDVSPNRLESAKLDISDLLERLRGDRAGLIAFAGRPTVKIPLTRDAEFFREALRPLSAADAPRGGTAIGEAIRLALRAVDDDSSRDRAILLITDGEDHESDALEAAGQAAAAGVKIYTVAIGDDDRGGRIPLYNDRGELTGYQKYKGKEIRTKADRGLLRQIAEKTGGAFLDMGKTPTDLGAFYRKSIRLDRSGSGEENRRVWKEKYQPPLLAGLVLIFFGCAVSPWRAERKAAAALLLAVLLLPLSGGSVSAASDDGVDFFDVPVDGQSSEDEPAAEPLPAAEPSPTADRDAENSGTFEEEPDPNLTAEELYNTACELAARGETDRAELCLRRGLDAARPREKSLRARLRYNLGVLLAGRLEAEAEKVFGETGGEAEKEPAAPGPADSAAGGNGAAAPRDAVADYRRGAERRRAALDELLNKTSQAAAVLRAAAADGGGKLRGDALRGSDLLLSWGEGQSRAFAEREREKRAKLFAPADQLRWLDEELTRPFEERVSAEEPRRAGEWQKIYEQGEDLAERKADLESLLEKGTFRDDGNPNDAAARLEHAESGLAALGAAAGTYSAGGESAVGALGGALAELDLARLTYDDYPAVVRDAVARQEEIVKKCGVSPEPKPDAEDAEKPLAREALLARGGAVARRLDRMTADAQKEFAERPYAEEEKEEAEGGGESPAEEAEGETEFFTPEPEEPAGENDSRAAAGQLSPEEKIRRSMNLALELAPEIVREEDALAALSAESFRAEAPRHEEAVLDLLRRIAEPLQDPNEQNQDSQNQQNQNRDGQDRQNQNPQNQSGQNPNDQNRDGGNPQDQNPQDREGEEEQSQDREGENPQDQDQRNQNGAQQNQSPQEEEQTQGESQTREERAATPEEEKARQQEEKAEAMMRKVGDRQRQVEALRRQRNRLFHRYEKPEKDW